MRKVMILAMILTLAVAVQAQTTVADFEGGENYGAWSFGVPGTVEDTGGNPDGWLHADGLDAPFPVFRSAFGAEGFTGDYVATGVNHISADFQCLDSSNQWIGTFMFCVFLRNDMGTPNDQLDDIYVYPNPENWTCPDIGEGWKHYDFDIPSDFVGGPGELPDGWLGGSYYTGNATFPEDAVWQDVISNVARLEFWWNHPDWAAIFSSFDVGADNIVVERQGGVATQQKTLSGVKALFE